jgi:hypothetical protein
MKGLRAGRGYVIGMGSGMFELHRCGQWGAWLNAHIRNPGAQIQRRLGGEVQSIPDIHGK